MASMTVVLIVVNDTASDPSPSRCRVPKDGLAATSLDPTYISHRTGVFLLDALTSSTEPEHVTLAGTEESLEFR